MPTCFISYSTREPYVASFIECGEIALKPHFTVDRTPSALQSGASQREQITKLIGACAFGIVVLDGLRPNVVFEYGIMQGMRKPVMLFKEAQAQVDISSFLEDAPDLNLPPVKLDLDRYFSDVKDINYAVWNRFEFRGTVRRVSEEYRKKKGEIEGYIEIPEPAL